MNVLQKSINDENNAFDNRQNYLYEICTDPRS